jgi:hypothetical protein
MRALFKRIASLPDRRMRAGVLAEALHELSPPAAARVLDEALQLERGDAQFLIVDALAVLSFKRERAVAIRDAAETLALSAVAEWVAPQLHREAAPVPHHALGDVPLGYRKTMARTGTRQWIDRLLRETAPEVIGEWLQNPRLREADVVALVARRPQRANILALVHASPWGMRHAVKRAIAFNPSAPAPLVLKIVPLLMRQECAQLAAEPGIDARVAGAARARVS